jgi:hypothetical protein
LKNSAPFPSLFKPLIIPLSELAGRKHKGCRTISGNAYIKHGNGYIIENKYIKQKNLW